ncbi:putative Dna-(apurinic or apyrimidinic site) lyase [Cardiosporidium cionae]|uniref:Dna-(Apurinic or apyrimidinic site) lyase n=1 Tax=Cardiosporidium cionae TaxID=476202 RepID=A0ABQ7J659_9APIC|nr:putative Dna-(apurinic or apyrimidinic site) lyase [Cardiosporidium cionae]|eukprot:KAF8819459.1 putative Dna-(apurinic or apyrimidinic site) lyase [Cardiosporidium cionae]
MSKEAKVSQKKLAADPKSISALLPTYDTFWCCCSQKRGFMGYSGTTTFCRISMTDSADSQPFSTFLSPREAIERHVYYDASSVALSPSPISLGVGVSIKRFVSSLHSVIIAWWWNPENGFPPSVSTPSVPENVPLSTESAAASIAFEPFLPLHFAWKNAAHSPPSVHCDLNDEGRLLITRHSHFSLLNVYVPTSGNGYSRLPYKMRFLHALRAKMLELRVATGLPVILVGDLNASYRGEDCYWADRLVNIRQLWSSADFLSSSPAAAVLTDKTERNFEDRLNTVLDETLLKKLREFGPSIEGLLREDSMHSILFVPGKDKAEKITSGNPFSINRRNDSYRFLLHVPKGSTTSIGKPFDSMEETLLHTSLKACTIMDTYEEDCKSFIFHTAYKENKGNSSLSLMGSYAYQADTADNHWIARYKDRLSVSFLADCFKAIQVPLTLNEQKQLSTIGESFHPPCLQKWMQALFQEDLMVDTFATVHPTYKGRFTAFDQYSNKRYTNEGVRIDYILLDPALYLTHIHPFEDLFTDENIMKTLTQQKKQIPYTSAYSTLGGKHAMKDMNEPTWTHPEERIDSEEHALNLVTAYCKWKPAPFDGSGLLEEALTTYNTQFPTCHPYIGMVYMPPRYSDHIAVCVTLKQALEYEKASQICQNLFSLVLPSLVIERMEDDLRQTVGRASDHSCILDKRCESTRRAQPHRQWQSIQSFLRKPSANLSCNLKTSCAGSLSHSLLPTQGKEVSPEVVVMEDTEENASSKLSGTSRKISLQETAAYVNSEKRIKPCTKQKLDLRYFFKKKKTEK